MARLPENNYLGRIKTGVVTASEKKGTPCFALVFEIYNEAVNGAWVNMMLEERTVRLFLSDAAMPYTRPKLESIGFNGEFDNPEFSNGEQVQLVCSHETYEGKIQERWEFAHWGEAREIKPAAPDMVRRLNALWRSQASPTKPPAPPQSKTAPAAAKPADPKQAAWDRLATRCVNHSKDERTRAWKQAIEYLGGDSKTYVAADWETIADRAIALLCGESALQTSIDPTTGEQVPF